MLIFTETKMRNLPQPLSETTSIPCESLRPPGYSLLLLYDALFHFVNRYMTGLLTLAQDGGQRASRS